MPIRFACSGCGQRLSVGSHKVGKTAACPKCKTKLTIPPRSVKPPAATDAAATEIPPAEEAQPNPTSREVAAMESSPEAPPVEATTFVTSTDEAAPLFDFASHIEVVYENQTTAAPPRSPRKRNEDEAILDLDRISLPRYVIFVQGILLAVVGIMCFLLGLAVGGAVSETGGPEAKGLIPIAVSGSVAFANDGKRTPDAGAVVILVPLGSKPEEKGQLEGIRPGDDPAAGVILRNRLRELGGGMATCDPQGEFSLQLPNRGRYYLLAISAHAKARPEKIAAPQEIAQMGQFFSLAKDPLDPVRYQWRLEDLRGSQKLNVNFD